MAFRHVLWAGALLALISTQLTARQQHVTVGSELNDYIRLLEVDGKIRGAPLVFRPLSNRQFFTSLAVDSSHLWFDYYPFDRRLFDSSRPTIEPIYPTADLLYNSKYPRTGNDGALWSGKGASGSVSGGVRAVWGPVTATLHPTVYFSQNSDFPLAPVNFNDRSAFAYPWHPNIDWPQRFGNDAIREFDLGQSGIRVDVGAFTAGISTENMWWGPSIQNPIIMGNSSPGFPHVDLGTGRPVSTGIGDVEARIMWGELHESDFFDADPTNQRRYITGLTVGYQPKFLPGLTLGGTRVLYQQWPDGGLTGNEIFDAFGVFFNPGNRDTLPSGQLINDLNDQMVSITGRWLFPESGFEAYVEWARGDFSGSFRDFVLEPDHSRAYTFGFQKVLPSHSGTFLLKAEHTTLGRSATIEVRANPTFYTHNFAIQGYTNKGQLLGAQIGPGGQSQFLGLDRYHPGGRLGVFFSRVRFNDDYLFGNDPPNRPHDTEFTLGFSSLWFLPRIDLRASLELSRRLNWNFVFENDVTNAKVGLRVGWRGE